MSTLRRLVKFLKRVKLGAKPQYHRVHRVNNRFCRCDCIFLKDVVNEIRRKLQATRLRATLD